MTIEKDIYLNVWGDFGLCYEAGEVQKCIQNPVPLLMASYVILEHKGSIEREEFCALFYPLKPQLPDDCDALTQQVYQQLWQNFTADNAQVVLRDLDTTQNELKQVQQRLFDLGVLSSNVINPHNNTYTYPLSNAFQAYLKKPHLTSAECKKNIPNHLNKLRQFLKEQLGDERAYHYIAKGNAGTKSKVEINLPQRGIDSLNQALAAYDTKRVFDIYQGDFLQDIEKKIKKFWIPPVLMDWIIKQRLYSRQAICNYFSDVISQHQNTAFLLQVKNFYERSKLDDIDLKKHIDSSLSREEERSLPLIKTEIVPSHYHDYLPKHRAIYLRKQVKSQCEYQLRLERDWMENQANISLLSPDSKIIWQPERLVQREEIYQFLFDSTQCFAVILGAAGIGKSLILLQLIEQMLEQTENTTLNGIALKIPLFFHLADWDVKTESFELWLKNQLSLRLGNKNIVEDFACLLDYQQAIFFLDGFDHIPVELRVSALSAINQFVQHHGAANLGGMILASREMEYIQAKEAWIEQYQQGFLFLTECRIQTLAKDYITSYAQEYIQLENKDWKKYLQLEVMQQFVNLPLGLNLFIEKMAQSKAENLLEGDVKQDEFKDKLIHSYIEHRITESNTATKDDTYSTEQIHTWLGHIANMTNMGGTFALERLSPTILPKNLMHQYQYSFILFFSIFFGGIMGGIAGLIFGKRVAAGNEVVVSWLEPVQTTLSYLAKSYIFSDKLMLVLIYAGIGVFVALSMSILSLLIFRRLQFIFFLSGYLAVFMGGTGYLLDAKSWSIVSTLFYGSLGIISGATMYPACTNHEHIVLSKTKQWFYKFTNLPKQDVLYGLLFIPLTTALVFIMSWVNYSLGNTKGDYFYILHAIFIGFTFTIAYFLYKLKNYETWKKTEFLASLRIRTMLINNIKIFLIISIIIIFIMLLFLPTSVTPDDNKLDWQGNLSLSLRVGFPLGFIFGFLAYGGVELIKYTALRFILYWHKIAPWDYQHFLDIMRRKGLLKIENNGYRFEHDWFQIYFKNYIK